MKMTKSQFKLMMKECLTELINEGAFDKKLEQIAEGKMKGGHLPLSSNSLNEQGNLPAGMNPKILEAVNIVTSGQPNGRKSMFQEILMDTAMTTLQKQLEGAGSAGLQDTSPISAAAAAQDEAQLFAISGGNPSRWATAAFAGKKKS
jgi:molybdopterin-biosynthesis enzyme MoeA-like protein